MVAHGQSLAWLRRVVPDNLIARVAALLTTGKVELRVCTRSREEIHWQLRDLAPGAVAAP